MSSNKYNEDDNMDLLFASYHGDLDEIVDLFFRSIPNVNVKGNNNVRPLCPSSNICRIFINTNYYRYIQKLIQYRIFKIYSDDYIYYTFKYTL